jgi:hypothetical protein
MVAKLLTVVVVLHELLLVLLHNMMMPILGPKNK